MSSENEKSKRVTLLHFRVSSDRIYGEDMDEMLRWQEEICRCANGILKKLAAIV